MSDELVLVDIYDNAIGSLSKERTHAEGRLHRAFSVFIFNGSKMLIQRRNINKYHSGGLWANACCSHPRVGEELHDAVRRRMKEEIGISCQVEKQFDFVYYTKFSDNLFEYEFDHVFLGEYSGNVVFDEEEIMEVKWVSTDELEKWMLEKPYEFSTWFLIAAQKILAERGAVALKQRL